MTNPSGCTESAVKHSPANLVMYRKVVPRQI